jgi:hypothetical protein
MLIETLSVTQFTRALSTFLLPTDGPNPSFEDFHLVFKVLTDWSIPVAHALADDGSFDCKVTSARLALSVLFLSGKETREAIGSLINKWYHDHSQWKAAFEAAIPIVVGAIILTSLKLHCMLTGERKQMGGSSCHPSGFNGSTTPRPPLISSSEVPSGTE